MNLLLAILLGTGAVIGALGMLALIAGGVAAAMIDADRGPDRTVVETTGRALRGRRPAPFESPVASPADRAAVTVVARPANPLAA